MLGLASLITQREAQSKVREQLYIIVDGDGVKTGLPHLWGRPVQTTYANGTKAPFFLGWRTPVFLSLQFEK